MLKLHSCTCVLICTALLTIGHVLLLLGKRPFGVSILYMGWDPHYGFQLYQSDPSGNYGGWKATCIGNNHQVTEYIVCGDSVLLSPNLSPPLPPLLFPLSPLFLLSLLVLSSSQAAISLLKQEYKDEPPTLEEALDLAVKVLYKTLDSAKLNSEKGTNFETPSNNTIQRHLRKTFQRKIG